MKLKKLVAFILAGVMAAALLSACGNSPSGNQQDAAKTTFTVGFDQDFPPYGYVGDDGQFTGFDIEMATECAKRMGLEIKLQPVDWDSKDLELSSGSIDCIWNGFTMTGREDDYTWTEPYMDNSQVFVVKKDSGITKVADLKDKVVTAQADSAALNALNDEEHADTKALFSKLLTCQQYNSAFMDLEAGAVDSVAMDIGVAKYQIQGKEDQYVILDEPILEEQYGVGFFKGNTELRDKVQNTLKEMVKENKGHILNVASIAGFMPGPLMATYYATKNYVVSLTRAIRKELRKNKSKVKISLLCPGPVDTNFNNVANVKFKIPGLTSEYVAKYAIKKMQKGKLIIIPGTLIKIVRWLTEITPDVIVEEFSYHTQTKKR